MIDVARELLENPDDDGKAKHLLENLDVNGQQENLDDKPFLEPMDTSVLPEEDPKPKNIRSDGCLFKPIIIDEDDRMLERVRSLSFEQRIVFDKFVQFTKTVLRNLNGASIVPIPPNIIVTGNNIIPSQFEFLNLLMTISDLHITGGGGVGKSYLIITLAKWTTKILASTDPNKAKVLLLAFTGVAASLIGN